MQRVDHWLQLVDIFHGPQVRSSKEKHWDHLVHPHHFLGKLFIVGSYLKYIAYLEEPFRTFHFSITDGLHGFQ